MDVTEFRERGQEIVDYIVDYLESVSERPVTPNVTPGFLRALLPSEAPKTGESFQTIMEDFEKYVIPGLVHWQHRRFHAYFPGNTSFPSILGEMLSDAIGCVGFDWNLSPAGIELETIMLNWVAKAIGLPDKFIQHKDCSVGGGYITNTASESIFKSMVSARLQIMDQLKQKNEDLCPETLLLSLVAYCSTESHSCVEKAALMSRVTIKILETDEDYRLRGETLARAIEEDKKNGLIPFFVSITLGSTSSCSCDPIDEIGLVCESQGLWLNVDAAYAGSMMICPEFRPFLKGIEYASSFNVNLGKLFLVNMDCSVWWTANLSLSDETCLVDRTLLYHNDFEEGGCHTSRKRYRALKVWFVIRCYGLEGLREYMRNHVRLAQEFENYVRTDKRFEVISTRFGLVCFRIKGSNKLNKKLVMAINSSATLHITGTQVHSKYIIRFCVCHQYANDDDIAYAWSVFRDFTSELLQVEPAKAELYDIV